MKHFGKTVCTFTAGMATSALLAAAVLPAAASGGQVSFGQIGVRLFGQPQFTAGETYTAPNGQTVPSSITYTDAAGGKTNYLSVRQIGDLLDADVRWNAAANSVDIAPLPTGDATVSSGDTTGGDYLTAPTYGQKIGAFEELDPQTVAAVQNPQEHPVVHLQDVRVQYQIFDFPTYTDTIAYEHGAYLVYSVTNNGTQLCTSQVYRQPTISTGTWERFDEVAVQPGQTLTRVFRVSKDANPLEYTLKFDVGGGFDPDNRDAVHDVTVSLLQYPG